MCEWVINSKCHPIKSAMLKVEYRAGYFDCALAGERSTIISVGLGQCTAMQLNV